MLEDGTWYYYVAQAVHPKGTSAYSNEGSARTNGPPDAPSGVTPSGYAVYRAEVTGGPYALAGTTLASPFIDSGLEDNHTYFYVVRAQYGGAESSDSIEVSPTTSSAPSGCSASGGNAQITVSWGAVAGATGYRVVRSATQGGTYQSVATPNGTTYSYTDTGLQVGTTYYYVVVATEGAYATGYSAEVSATTTPAVAPRRPGHGRSWTHLALLECGGRRHELSSQARCKRRALHQPRRADHAHRLR